MSAFTETVLMRTRLQKWKTQQKNAVSKLLQLSLLLHSIPSSHSMPQTDPTRQMRNSWQSLHSRLQTGQNQQLLFRATVRTKKAGGAGLVPKPSKDCVKCGVCSKNCPVQAIDPVKFTADSKKCIACMRCVKQCPHNARKVNGAMVSVAALAIKRACSVRKENELFL